MARGWSIKDIQRLIVNSATYRQASASRPECLAVDAGSRLLWRFPPRRLDAEPIRDLILAVSGKLDLRLGGPGFSVFEPNDNTSEFMFRSRNLVPPNGDEWFMPRSSGSVQMVCSVRLIVRTAARSPQAHALDYPVAGLEPHE